MSESYPHNPELSADQFIEAVLEANGHPDTLLQQHPYLGVKFTGLGVPSVGEAFDKGNPQMPVPLVDAPHYGVGAGDSIRARGTFQVLKSDDSYKLRFASDRPWFDLQEIDEPTARAFANYGPTYSEVILGLAGVEKTPNGDRYSVFLESVTAVQESLESAKQAQPNELLRIEGTVINYSAGSPDTNPKTGPAVITEPHIEVDYNGETDTSLTVRLPDGTDLLIHHPRVSSEMEYDGNVSKIISDRSPKSGDLVRIAARGMNRLDYGFVEGSNGLDVLYTQLRAPSEERVIEELSWQNIIGSQLNKLKSSSKEDLPAVLQDLLLDSAYYKRSRVPNFNLDDRQKQYVVSTLEDAFADNPEDLPLATEALRNDDATFLLAEAAQGYGVRLLSMSKHEAVREFYGLLEQGEAEFSQLSELLATTFTEEERLELAKAATGNRTNDSEIYKDTVRSIFKVTEGIFNKRKAEILSDVLLSVPHLEDRYDAETAYGTAAYYLGEEIDAMEKVNDEQTLKDRLAAFGVYCDTFDKLKPHFVEFRREYPEEAILRASYAYYQIARQQGLLP